MVTAATTYDAIVVGSGASGGWAAKRLAEAGLNVVVLEAGRARTDGDNREHVPPSDLKYRGQTRQPLFEARPQQAASYALDEWNADWFVKDLQEPYTTPPGAPFPWVGRVRLVGGRTNVWGRQAYRWSDTDFKGASIDGAAADWPLSYADLAPYYDIVERYIGVSGRAEGHPLLPDGSFLPPMAMSCAEQALVTRVRTKLGRTITIGRTANLTQSLNGRAPCHYCGPCERGCTTHSYFNSAYTTIPDALATGRCTLVTDAMVSAIAMDPDTHKATGVRYIDRNTREVHDLRARVVVVCAQMFESVRLLLNSRTRQDPNGLGNSSGLLGKNLMVHITDAGARATMPEFSPSSPPLGGPNRPNALFAIRFRNLPGEKGHARFLRGYGYEGGASVEASFSAPGFGNAYKAAVRRATTHVNLQGFGESLPHPDNFCEIDPGVVDAFGVPVLRINMHLQENDRQMLQDMADSAAEILEAAGGRQIRTYNHPRWASHEAGCARMGTDPKTSVLTPFQQLHDVSNVYVMDASGFPSGGWSNPTLTIMALAVRSTDRLLERMKAGEI
jgi:choline dehydrogenase-like flavoprotein